MDETKRFSNEDDPAGGAIVFLQRFELRMMHSTASKVIVVALGRRPRSSQFVKDCKISRARKLAHFEKLEHFDVRS